MALNEAVTATTQIGVANGTDEGYATQADVAATMGPQFPANSIPASAVQGIPGADDDVDTVTFTVAAGGNLQVAVTEGGTTVTGAMNVTALATAIASSPAAVATLMAAWAAAPVADRAPLAGALLSTDADNSATIGTDGLIYENDAVV